MSSSLDCSEDSRTDGLNVGLGEVSGAFLKDGKELGKPKLWEKPIPVANGHDILEPSWVNLHGLLRKPSTKVSLRKRSHT